MGSHQQKVIKERRTDRESLSEKIMRDGKGEGLHQRLYSDCKEGDRE